MRPLALRHPLEAVSVTAALLVTAAVAVIALPFTASAALAAPASATQAATQATTPGAAQIATPTATAGPGACTVESATLTWGVKESFRSYISGTIARGQWQTTGDAAYATPAFTWSSGTGTAAPSGAPAEVSFTGGIRFTGHDGLLDTTLADPTLVIDQPGHAVLRLDVSGVTMDAAMAGETTATTSTQVPFVDIDLSGATTSVDGDTVTINAAEAPTAITAEGFAAFGNYEAGTPFDPISLQVSATCPPAQTATAGPTPTSEAQGDHADAEDAAPAASGGAGGTGWAATAAIVAGLAVVAAAVAVVIARRRRADREGEPAPAVAAADEAAPTPTGPGGPGDPGSAPHGSDTDRAKGEDW